MKYTVKHGDTSTSIAREVYGDERYFRIVLGLEYPNSLSPGMILSLPDDPRKTLARDEYYYTIISEYYPDPPPSLMVGDVIMLPNHLRVTSRHTCAYCQSPNPKEETHCTQCGAPLEEAPLTLEQIKTQQTISWRL